MGGLRVTVLRPVNHDETLAANDPRAGIPTRHPSGRLTAAGQCRFLTGLPLHRELLEPTSAGQEPEPLWTLALP
jgi:hypothetical protein